MACTVSSAEIAIELYVIKWHTGLTSSASPIYSQQHTWFEAWHPNQSTLSLTIRQPLPEKQWYVIDCLQRWANGNQIVNIDWPERGIDYDAVIISAPLERDYRKQMNDCEVQFFLLTNSILPTRQTFSYSGTAIDMFLKDLVTDTIDSADKDIKQQEKKDLETSITKAQSSNQQFSNCEIVYGQSGYVYIMPKASSTDTESARSWKYYQIKLDTDLMQHLQKGDDLYTYLEKRYQEGDATKVTKSYVTELKKYMNKNKK